MANDVNNHNPQSQVHWSNISLILSDDRNELPATVPPCTKKMGKGVKINSMTTRQQEQSKSCGL